MTRQEKLKQNLIFNLMFQILDNQVNSMNGILTHEAQKKSNKLMVDCLEFIKVENEPTKETPVKDLKELNVIFKYWNTKDCFTTHQTIVGNTTAIRAILGKFTIDQVKDSIDNYEFVYESSAHWYSTKLNLNKFLNYKASEFVNDSCRTTFLRGNYGNQPTQQSNFSDEESIKIARNAQKQARF